MDYLGQVVPGASFFTIPEWDDGDQLEGSLVGLDGVLEIK
jgi:hypothetical protein